MKQLNLEDVRIRAAVSPQTTVLSIGLTQSASENLMLSFPLKWSGKIRGPFCSRSQTLAANYSLNGEDASKSAQAVIPDFCHWTANLPFTYDLEFQLSAGDRVEVEFRERIAVAWITLHRGKLYRSGKRWIPRMASLPLAFANNGDFEVWLEEVRTNDLVLVVSASDVSADFLSKCQRHGVCVAIEMQANTAGTIARAEAAGCVPVILAHYSQQPAMDTSLFIATQSDSGERCWEISSQSSANKAYMAVRPGKCSSAAEARRTCDELQASVAHERDWAGYLV